MGGVRDWRGFLVNAAHGAGKGVLLDLVYNHMNDSPLTQIAIDAYRNGDAWGDKINNARPMRLLEFFFGRRRLRVGRISGFVQLVVTFGTENQQQDSGWLGLPSGSAYKEIFKSSWPLFQVEFEAERTNGGYDARIYAGEVLSLPFIGAVVMEEA